MSKNLQTLQSKIDKISSKFELAEELVKSEVVQEVEDNVNYAIEVDKDISPTEVISLNTMVSDFKYTRDTLKTLIETARGVSKVISSRLNYADDETISEMVGAFTELNNSISNSMKIYTLSYKQISEVLVNLGKVNKPENSNSSTSSNSSTTNNVTINTTETINTVDLIARMNES